MARNKSSLFGVADELQFDQPQEEKREEIKDVIKIDENIKDVIGLDDTDENSLEAKKAAMQSITTAELLKRLSMTPEQPKAPQARQDQLDRDADEMFKRYQQQIMKEKPLEIGHTQGKKGQKLHRISMAFSDLNYAYITKKSRQEGMTYTAFVNMIIEEWRRRHSDA